jgi:predicted dehydrogenase
MEAIQFRHHSLTRRFEEIIASGEIGTLQRVDVTLCVLLPKFKANCYNYAMAGGAMMDAGSYVANMAHTFGGRPRKLFQHRRSSRSTGWTGP